MWKYEESRSAIHFHNFHVSHLDIFHIRLIFFSSCNLFDSVFRNFLKSESSFQWRVQQCHTFSKLSCESSGHFSYSLIFFLVHAIYLTLCFEFFKKKHNWHYSEDLNLFHHISCKIRFCTVKICTASYQYCNIFKIIGYNNL